MRGVFIGYGRDLAQAVEERRLGRHIAEELKARLLDMALSGLFDFMQGRRGGGGFWGAAAGFAGSLFGGGRAGGGSLRRGYHYDVVEDGRPELAVFGRDGQMFSHTDTVNMLRDLAGAGGANGARTGAGVTVYATYAPHNTVEGSGPEIDAMRRELAEERAGFKQMVWEAFSDGVQSGNI